jgi:hypothetical protein
MFWQTVNFFVLVEQLLPTFLRKNRMILFLSAIVTPLVKIYENTLYKMQHDGRTIYLEKMLNEHFEVVGYDYYNHETTKLVYIDDIPEPDKLYIFQDEEDGVSFLEDDGDDNDEDIFLDNDTEGVVSYSWVIFVPDTFVFQEYQLRALVDTYRYFGKKYKIETYTL